MTIADPNKRPTCARCSRFYRTLSAAGGYQYWCLLAVTSQDVADLVP